MWAWLAVATAVLWGVTYTCSSYITKHIDVKTSLAIQCLLQTIIALIWVSLDGCLIKDLVKGNFLPIWPVFLLATISSFVACYCSIASVKYGGAEFASMIEISYPIFVIIFASLAKGRIDVSWNTIIGGIIIAIGTVFVIRSH